MSAVLTEARRAILRRRVRWIVGCTIAYNAIEAVVAIWAGAIASSAALIGFGLDSIVEVMSAAAVAWQFSRRDPERWEHVTVRVIAIAFFALAAYVAVDAIVALVGSTPAERSPLGIGIAASSVIIMPALAWFEMRTGRELGSGSVVADAKQLLVCTYLSAAVLVGLLANALLGWWWADAVAALVVAAIAVREGVEAWRGDLCCAPPLHGDERGHDAGSEREREREHGAPTAAGRAAVGGDACCASCAGGARGA